ncbi:Serine/threonine-protein phosphatase 2A regulatory subunit B'' subunit alpha [Mortierella sp. AD010]|nr:Serine/threonine-protein phosphatase 2A regulatory subunit B'' subunit alpha [Mortierella sp. AD010]
MTLSDLRRANFDKTLRKLEDSDLNQTEDCFSYKHFYVIYCKFWELDKDHDLVLDEQDLASYSSGAISTRIIRRVMQGYGNETGMFMIPDQDLLFQQQQQQQQQQQYQQQQQQYQQQQQQQQQQLTGEQVLQRDQQVPQFTSNIPTVAEGDTRLNLDGTVPTETEFDMETVDLEDGALHTLKQSESMTPCSADVMSEAKDGSPILTGEPSPTLEPATSPLMPSPTVTSAIMTTPQQQQLQRTILPGPGSQCRPQNYRMTYKGFIWFLLAETDKQTTTSIEYWFRCMDLDGDGVLSVFELEQLFLEQTNRMAVLGMEPFGFRDAICQMQDLVCPKETGLVRLSDLKQCGQAGPFIDLFCNVLKWRSFEAYQHQIRMRQQQIAMQRAADAAWEEAAVGEDLFDGEFDDFDDIDDDYYDDDEDLYEDDCDNDDDDEEEEMEGFEDDYEANSFCTGDDELSQTDSEGSPSSVSSTLEDYVTTTKGTTTMMTQSNTSLTFVGLGIDAAAMEDSEQKKNDIKPMYQEPQGVNTNMDMEGNSLEEAVEMSTTSVKAELRRERAKARRRRQRRLMMKRALLVEQRKEKALLASIRESPWIIYVEVEYEKLISTERPQSRADWGQEEDEEEEGEMDDEEIMDEADMMMEEGRDPTMGQQYFQDHIQIQQQIQQQQQLQQQQFQQRQFQQQHFQQLQLQFQREIQLQQQQQIQQQLILQQQQQYMQHMQQRQYQGGVMAQSQADVINGEFLVEMDQMRVQSGAEGGSVGRAGMMVIGFETDQDFEQISIEPHNQTTAAAAAAAKVTGSAIHY